jgi:exonuclease SbcC
MRINTVKLKNIGPHKDLEVKFGRGLIGLVGSNGAGKSTLVNSIYAALTNDFSRFGNSKSEIITNGTTEDSFIKLTGEHRGQQFELIRWLKPNKSEFTFGDNSYSKATDINEAVVAQLNIPKLVIDKYVFVNQWEMFGFLDQSAGERAKTFQYLCGTEAATTAYKVCADYVAKQKNLQIVDNSFELQSSVTGAEEAMAEHRNKAKSVEKFILTDVDLTAYQELLDLEKAGLDAVNSLTDEKAEEHKLIKELEEHANELTVLQEKIDKRNNWKERNEINLKSAYDLVEAYSEYEFIQADSASATSAIALLKKKLKVLKKPVKNKELYVDAAEQKKLSAQEGRLQVLIEQAENVNTDEAVCPHCLQEVSATHVEKLQADLETNRQKLADIAKRIEHSCDYDQNLELFNKKQTDIKNSIAQFEATLAENNKRIAEFGGGNNDAAESLLQKEKEVDQQLKKFEKQARVCSSKQSQATGKLKAIQATIAKLKAKVKARPAGEEIARVRLSLSQHEKATSARQAAVGAYREAKKSRDRAQTTLDHLKSQLNKQLKIQNLLDTISEAGEVFHWNNLPKVVSQANLELLVNDINNNLQLFNSPFVVEADQDLTFKVYFPGQLPVKAKQLSGGQKVMLAIAFRAALDRVFGHDTGMMYLDEPTSGLDADNVKYFHDALQKLAERQGSDRQLVVITHVHELSGAFDQLVQL